MKRLFFLVFLVSVSRFVSAQNNELLVKTGDKGLYLEHKVMPKEGLYSLGRLYNVHPRHLSKYNGLDFNKGLAIGQVIRIPLSDTNFNQKTNDGVPVYYKVGEKEGLMKVSNQHNKVALENLRNWNNLSNDNVDFGRLLIVGHLVSKEMKFSAPVTVVATPPEVKTEVKKTEPPVVVEEKKQEPIKAPEIKKDEPKIIEEVKQPEKKPEIIPAVRTETIASEEGFFKWHFEQQQKQKAASNDKTVTSGIFKTTSGWTDRKYYLLIDGVEPGTIVKISNPSNNKSVFAKVLGQMEGINLNKGLDIRISNAAANILGVTETDKFIVKVNY